MARPTADELIPQITFGDRLRRFRISRGMTLREFAEGTHMSAATLGRYEHDGGADDQATRRVANLVQVRYGIPAEWLLTGAQVTGECVAAAQSDLALAA